MMYSVGPVMSGETTFTEKNKEIIKNIYRDSMDIIIKHILLKSIKKACKAIK